MSIPKSYTNFLLSRVVDPADAGATVLSLTSPTYGGNIVLPKQNTSLYMWTGVYFLEAMFVRASANFQFDFFTFGLVNVSSNQAFVQDGNIVSNLGLQFRFSPTQNLFTTGLAVQMNSSCRIFVNVYYAAGFAAGDEIYIIGDLEFLSLAKEATISDREVIDPSDVVTDWKGISLKKKSHNERSARRE